VTLTTVPTLAVLASLALASACSRGPAAPRLPAELTVVATAPEDGTFEVRTEAGVSARFSEALDPASLTPDSFLVTTGAAAVPVAVPGTVSVSGATAHFQPTEPLADDTLFTATITTAATSAAGVPLSLSYQWSFTTPLPPGNQPASGSR